MRSRAVLCLVVSAACAGGALVSAAIADGPEGDTTQRLFSAWESGAGAHPPSMVAADGGRADAAAAEFSFPQHDVPLVAGPRHVVSAESSVSRDGLLTERWRVLVHPATHAWRRTAAMSLTRAGYISSGRVRAPEGQATAVWMSRGSMSVHFNTALTLTGAVVYTVDRRAYLDVG